MDYEKAYKAVLQTATQWIKDGCTDKEKICLECVFPELRESEDERIRKALVKYFEERNNYRDEDETFNGIPFSDIIAYLEKQKTYKPTDEDERIRVVILKLVLGMRNEIFTTADKLVTKPKVLAWLKKQKEQEPVEWSDNFEDNIRTLLHDKLTWHSEDGNMSSTVFIDDKTLKDIISGIWFYVGKEALKYPNKKLNVSEWSEEDEEIFNNIIEKAKGGHWIEVNEITWLINRFKSLRPSWKPSEEQMEALKECGECKRCIKELYEQLKGIYNNGKD